MTSVGTSQTVPLGVSLVTVVGCSTSFAHRIKTNVRWAWDTPWSLAWELDLQTRDYPARVTVETTNKTFSSHLEFPHKFLGLFRALTGFIILRHEIALVYVSSLRNILETSAFECMNAIFSQLRTIEQWTMSRGSYSNFFRFHCIMQVEIGFIKRQERLLSTIWQGILLFSIQLEHRTSQSLLFQRWTQTLLTRWSQCIVYIYLRNSWMPSIAWQ